MANSAAARASQFATPCVVLDDGHCESLDRLPLSESGRGARDEDWLQEQLFNYPSLLPIAEVEATFDGAVPLCRELMTAVGPLDILLINEDGLLTLVECKLWRNPEARRKVVGQILDYAQAISRWRYEDLEAAVQAANGNRATSLWDIAQETFGLTDEAAFVDRVARHLRESRFLLLIVGDGIRENTEQIGDYLKAHAGLSFTLGLVEQQLFSLPGGRGILVQPRILAKTVELGRLVVRAETGQIIAGNDSPGDSDAPDVPRTLTEDIFVEEVAGATPLAAKLRKFFDDLKRAGLLVQPTGRDNGLKICSPRYEHNLLTLNRRGEARNYGVGSLRGGRKYLQELVAAVPGSTLREAQDGGWRTTITTDERAWHVPVKALFQNPERVVATIVQGATELDEANNPSKEK
jgi:hypothetical protein